MNVQKAATGSKRYGLGEKTAPTRGQVDPRGYIQRELKKPDSDRRAGIAQAALKNIRNFQPGFKGSSPEPNIKQNQAIGRPVSTNPVIKAQPTPLPGVQPSRPGQGQPQPQPQVQGGRPFYLEKPANMSMDEWARLDPATGMSLMQQATYYKNGQELRDQFARGSGVINAAKGVPGAYKDPRTGNWQMDMKPENLAAYLAWNQNQAQVGNASWYGKNAGVQAAPQYQADYSKQATAKTVFDDYLNAQGMGWAANGNFSDANMVNAGAIKRPDGTWDFPDWYDKLGTGQASATGYQRQTAHGMMSDNEYRNAVMQGNIEGFRDQYGQADPFRDLWGAQMMGQQVNPMQAMQVMGRSPVGNQKPPSNIPKHGIGKVPNRQNAAIKHVQSLINQYGNRNKGIPTPPRPTTMPGGISRDPAPYGQPGRPGGGTPQPNGPTGPMMPTVKINENGQLDLPFNEAFSLDLINQQQQANMDLLELQRQEQAQQMQFARTQRDAGQAYDDQKRGTLNDNAARGMAFSSGYAVNASDDARNYNNFMNDLLADNTAARNGFSQQRTGIINAMNDFIRQAVMRNSMDLAGEAGNLGYGTSKTESSYGTPGQLRNQQKPKNNSNSGNNKPKNNNSKPNKNKNKKNDKPKPRNKPKRGAGYRAEKGKGGRK